MFRTGVRARLCECAGQPYCGCLTAVKRYVRPVARDRYGAAAKQFAKEPGAESSAPRGDPVGHARQERRAAKKESRVVVRYAPDEHRAARGHRSAFEDAVRRGRVPLVVRWTRQSPYHTIYPDRDRSFAKVAGRVARSGGPAGYDRRGGVTVPG